MPAVAECPTRTAVSPRPEPPPERPEAAPAPPPAAQNHAPPTAVPWRETRTLLHGVPWELYRALGDLPHNRHVRLTYDRGTLEIEVTTGVSHESVSRLLFAFVSAFLDERQTSFRPTGAATWARPDLTRGLEGDETFYIAGFDAIRGKDQPDLSAGDPPPDLAVEVVFSSPLLDKPAIYAALGVPEVWTWRDGTFTVRVLGDGGEYAVAEDSAALPGFPFPLAAALIERRADAGQNELVAEFRAGLSG